MLHSCFLQKGDSIKRPHDRTRNASIRVHTTSGSETCGRPVAISLFHRLRASFVINYVRKIHKERRSKNQTANMGKKVWRDHRANNDGDDPNGESKSKLRKEGENPRRTLIRIQFDFTYFSPRSCKFLTKLPLLLLPEQAGWRVLALLRLTWPLQVLI